MNNTTLPTIIELLQQEIAKAERNRQRVGDQYEIGYINGLCEAVAIIKALALNGGAR